jgi:beta-lactamase regulating signal transducer with metallopeptidase domain
VQSQPSNTTVTKTTNAVDPLWLALGAIGLIALLAIIFLASRGRSRNSSVVHERETVVRK